MNYDRFKIRVWDKEEKCTLYIGDKFNHKYLDSKTIFQYFYVGIENDTIFCTSRDGLCNTHCFSLSNRFIPMQCTGLKDENGKLIYEGDIIKSIDAGNMCGCGCDYIIEYDEKGQYTLKTMPDNVHISFDIFFWMENIIIGNIHENSYFLTEKQNA